MGTVSHDTLISDTPAADDGVAGHAGCELMEIFTHDETSFVDGFPLSSYTDIPDATQDFIRKHGAPDVLMSDNHKANISQELVKVLRLHHILGRTSEQDQQNQNTAERRIQDLKNMIDGVMDRAFVPAKYWLLTAIFVINLYNVLALPKLGWQTPTEGFKGHKPDLSPWCKHRFWEPVYYHEDERKFPSQSKERLGRWVGPAMDCGDFMTFDIIDAITGKLVKRSVTRSALDPNNVNLRAEFELLASVEGEELGNGADGLLDRDAKLRPA
jgi:hypothetical protein